MADNSLTNSADDLESPVDAILRGRLTVKSLSELFEILFDAYSNLDSVCLKAAAAGRPLFSPVRGERLTEEQARGIMDRKSNAAEIRHYAEDVKKRIDRVEERIHEILSAIDAIEQNNSKLDAIKFRPTLQTEECSSASAPEDSKAYDRSHSSR